MKHWRLEESPFDGELMAEPSCALLTLDVAGQSANVLSLEILRELEEVLTDLETKKPPGLVICSGKASGFLLGADVTEFQKVSDREQATGLARFGQRLFDRIAQLPCPTVALIHGHCLGGGLEMALACDYRIARDDPATRLGLPEVRLGIHPGFAGSVRLPKVVGHLPALELMLTGRGISAGQARRLGLVDEVVPERHLMHAALAFVTQKPARKRPLLSRRLPGWPPLRPLVSQIMLRQLRKRGVHPEHYPAPYRIIELWRRRAGAEAEAASVGELLVGRTSRNLVRVFLLGEKLKRLGRSQPHSVEHVHVIGAGVMGGDIATWIAYKGFKVSLQDERPEAVGRAVKRAYDFFKQRLEKPREVEAALDRLMPDLSGSGLKRADLVIEAIVEDVSAKRELFSTVEKTVRPEALLGTNTSSIPLERIAPALQDPSRLVGLHFFNPATRMQLVEVVRAGQSSEGALARARGFVTAIDRLPLDVKSSPGFLVNRVLMPYLLEAVKMAEEGIPLAEIDQAAVRFGMPMGPLELADLTGLDICLAVAGELSKPLGIAVPERLRAKVERGELGRKSGRGFYHYDRRGKAQKAKGRGSGDASVTDRLILSLLNEAMACLREGVAEDADAVDAGIVYGTGFAPHLGGPMRYIEDMGESLRHRLDRLAQEYGARFEPDEGWGRPELLAALPLKGRQALS